MIFQKSIEKQIWLEKFPWAKNFRIFRQPTENDFSLWKFIILVVSITKVCGLKSGFNLLDTYHKSFIFSSLTLLFQRKLWFGLFGLLSGRFKWWRLSSSRWSPGGGRCGTRGLTTFSVSWRTRIQRKFLPTFDQFGL